MQTFETRGYHGTEPGWVSVRAPDIAVWCSGPKSHKIPKMCISVGVEHPASDELS